MGNLSGFNADEHYNPERGEWKPIPVGEVLLCHLKHGKWEETKARKGRFLHLQFEVIQDGDYKGRKLDARLNLENPSSKAMSMAKEELADVCKAVGVNSPNDTSELENIPLYIQVGQEKREWQGEERIGNIIKKYISRAEHESQQRAAATAEGAEGDAKPSWMN